jgi:catechol 2,3-dioxygenase-like lactoylglutathione lyase family enzyme
VGITLLYGCCHIELSVRDLDAARVFMEGVLGGALIEQELAASLRKLVPDDGGIDHVDCGGATFQLNQPSPALAAQGRRSVHQDYLDLTGPCITNLNFYVDDIVHARDLLTALGAESLMQGPSSIADTFADYGPDNTRPDVATRPFYYLSTRPLLGLDLEILEPNFDRFVDQTAQSPCFVGERPGTGVPGLRLERLCIAVRDLAATYANLVEILTPGSRSNPYAVREGSFARAFRITVGGLELEYCQPLGVDGALAEHLDRHGPGVVAAAFSAPDIGSVVERALADASVSVTEAVDLVGEDQGLLRSRLASRELVGFDVVLEQIDEHALVAPR